MTRMKRCLPTVRIHQNPATNSCSKMAVKTSFSSKHSAGNRSLQRRLRNKLRSRIEVRCEHIFGRISQMALDQLRSIGLARANQHIGLSNLVYNMDRYAFLCK